MAPPGWNKTVVGEHILWTHPESTMDVASLPPDFFEAYSPAEQAMELIWRNGLANLSSTNNEIVVPFNIVRRHGYDLIRDVAFLLECHLELPISAVLDFAISAIRILPLNDNPPLLPLDLRTHKLLTEVVKAAIGDGLEIPVERAHIPRPPNSFILYRQHHHHAISDANPNIPNTKISRIIADMWRNEAPEVRNNFKELAEEKKKLHAMEHPNYQYSPRRPSEKVRRPRKIHVNNMPWLGQFPRGQQLVNDALNDSGYIPVNNEFIAAIDELEILRGPNGIVPMTPHDTSTDDKDVDSQVNGDLSLTAVQWFPLEGNEFDDTFPMDEMLNLEGA